MPLSETVLVIVCLLALSVVAAALCRRFPIPFTVLLVVLGMALAALAETWAPLSLLHEFQLSPDLVLFIFLPALIFESGYNLDGRQLLKNLAPVLTLAVPALIISTAMIGTGLWLILGLDLILALLFGALISATDPIAVIALFKELGAPLRLTVLVEGESLFNDATAIVIFKVLVGFALLGGLHWQDTGAAAIEFCRVFFGGVGVGIVFGMALSELMRLLRARSAILTLSVIMAYASFTLAEHYLHVSGVMAVVTAALCLSAWGRTRISREAADAMHDTWEFVAYVCNALLFLLVGLSVSLPVLGEYFFGIVVAVVLVLAVRAATVYSLVPATTRLFHLPKVHLGERHIMWWGGLKGGLAIAIALSIPESIPGREMLLALTVGVVVFTLLVNASTIRLLMQALGIDRLSRDEQAEMSYGITRGEEQAEHTLERFQQSRLISRAMHRSIRADIKKTLEAEEPDISGTEELRHGYLSLLRIELETLDELFEAGVVPQYTLLGVRNQLQHERDYMCEVGKLDELISSTIKRSFFLRMEMMLLRRLREQDWLAGLLSRYQNLRMAQRLRYEVARMMMVEAALEHLEGQSVINPGIAKQLKQVYEQRLKRLQENVERLRQDFPEFFQRFVFRMAKRSALSSAIIEVGDEHKHGQIGGKALSYIQKRITTALDTLPPISSHVPGFTPRELIQAVPLFSELSEDTLTRLAEQASTVTFLPGDVIIGQGEKGDALYIIMHGSVKVYRTREDGSEEQLAMLQDGEFFGEMALLGDQVRSVNVSAEQTTKLLRLTRKQVLTLAGTHPEVDARLRQADADRRKMTDTAQILRHQS